MNIKQTLKKIAPYKFKVLALAGLMGGLTACKDPCKEPDNPFKPDEEQKPLVNLTDLKVRFPGKDDVYFSTEDNSYKTIVMHQGGGRMVFDNIYAANDSAYFKAQKSSESVAFKSIAQRTLKYSDIGIFTFFDEGNNPIDRMPYTAINDASNKKPSTPCEFKGIAHATIGKDSEESEESKSFFTTQATLSVLQDGTEIIMIPCDKDTIKIIANDSTFTLKHPEFKEDTTLVVQYGIMPNGLRTRYSANKNGQKIFTDISTDYYGSSDDTPTEVIAQGIHNEITNTRQYIKYVFGGVNQKQK